MEVLGNKDSGETISTRLLGKGTQIPSLSPDAFSCLDSQKDSYEIGNCVQKFCAITPKARVQLGSKTTPKTVI